jgi:DNA uptake protein and related DNA-binding proteins
MKKLFTFTKGQQLAIILLLLTILSLLCIRIYLPYFITTPSTKNSTSIQQLLSQIQIDSNVGYSNNYYSKKADTPAKLTPFRFNPNTLDSAGWIRLGLPEKTVRTILNYRNKGGRFYNHESLKRIYGLHEIEYQQLATYIDIPNSYAQKPKEHIQVELNSADTSLLKKLNGIGSKLSQNIIQYREQLGGYVRVEQLKEVWGIQEETYEKIKSHCKVNTSSVKKINLNEAPLAELNKHPYLKGDIAKAIADFRKAKQYQIDQLSQLKEIELIDEQIFRKIAPYLTLQ